MRWGRMLTAVLLLLTNNLWAEDKPEETSTPAEAPAADAPAVAEPTKPIERAPLIGRSTQQALELANQYPEAAKTLGAEGQSFLSFWKPANTEHPKGTIILLPSTGETPDWPNVIGPLWQNLPDYGWHTLSVTLPDPEPDIPPRPPEPPRPPATPEKSDENNASSTSNTEEKASESSASESEASPAPDASPEPPEAAPEETPPEPPLAERINARIDAALAFAREQETPALILLGHGTGGYWAAAYLRRDQAEPIPYLILISALNAPSQEPLLTALTAQLGQTQTSDFYYPNRLSEQREATARRNACRRAKRTGYELIALTPLPSDPQNEQTQLVRKVRGWLDKTVSKGAR